MKRTLTLVILAAVAFGAAFAATKLFNKPPSGMVWIPGGEFTMGTNDPEASPAERPAHRVRLDGFWIDSTDVTNADFRRFVEATGYLTTAEKAPTAEEIQRYAMPG